jgi:hypothetical protein
MSGPQLLGLARRMKRIGEQQKTIDESGLVRSQHGSLTSAIGMSAEKDAAAVLRARLERKLVQTGSVARGIAWSRRARWTLLTIGQIDAQHMDSEHGDRAIHRHQERSVAVRPGAVSENEGIRQDDYDTKVASQRL